MLNVFSRGSLTSFNQVIRYSTVLLQFCCCCCSCYRHLTLLTLLEKQWCGWWCGQHRPVFTVYVVTFSVVCQLKGCIREVGHWVSANRLKLNTDKNELVWTGSRHNLRLLGGCSPSLQLGNDVIKPSDYVRLLGATIAADLGLDKHVSNVCKTCFFWLRQLRRVHCSLDIESVKMLVPALSHRVSTIATLFCLPCQRRSWTSCSMSKMLQHLWSQGPANMCVVCHGWFMMTYTGSYSSASAVQACYDSPSLSSAPSSNVPRRLLHASLQSSWSPASVICQMSSTVSSTSSP